MRWLRYDSVKLWPLLLLRVSKDGRFRTAADLSSLRKGMLRANDRLGYTEALLLALLYNVAVAAAESVSFVVCAIPYIFGYPYTLTHFWMSYRLLNTIEHGTVFLNMDQVVTITSEEDEAGNNVIRFITTSMKGDYRVRLESEEAALALLAEITGLKVGKNPPRATVRDFK